MCFFNAMLLFFDSISDDEQESGCDTVDGSPTSDSSGHDSPFVENGFVANTNKNKEARASVNPETKSAVCTVVVPPMRIGNRLRFDGQMVNTGKLVQVGFFLSMPVIKNRNLKIYSIAVHMKILTYSYIW